jgi:uncharacterized protein (DUF983 family)
MSNPYEPPQTRPSRAVLISRALRLRCPLCGTGKLFRTWFKMLPSCSHCRLKFEREPGYYLGSIYINYGLTAVLMTAGYMLGIVFKWAAPSVLLWTAFAFTIVFPLLMFPFSRALWLAFDLAWDPPERGDFIADADAS